MAATNVDLDRAHPKRVGYALALMPILLVVGLAIGLGVGVRGDDVTELGLALITTVIALLPLILDQGRRPSERHVLLSTFSIVFIIGFVLPVLVIFMPGDGPINAPSFGWSALYPVDIIRGQLATILGLLCLLVGYVSPIGRLLGSFSPRFRGDWPPQASLAVALFLIPIGWGLVMSSVFGVRVQAAGTGVLSVLVSAYLYGIALLTIVYLRHQSRLALLLLVIVVPITSAFGLFTSSKSAILLPPAMAVLSFIIVQRRIRARWIALAVLATALVYPVSRFVRMDLLDGGMISPITTLRNPVAALGKMSLFLSGSRPGEYFIDGLNSVVARMDCIGAASVLIRDTPSVAPFQNGRTLGLFFVAFIPRVLWPEKPTITIGRYITDVYGSGPEIETSTAPTQLGELFINFGYPGIIGGMLLYGIVLRLAHEILLRGRPTTPGLLVAVLMILRLGTGFQGDTANNWALIVMTLPPIILAHFAVRMLFPGAPRPHPQFDAGSGSAVAQR